MVTAQAAGHQFRLPKPHVCNTGRAAWECPLELTPSQGIWLLGYCRRPLGFHDPRLTAGRLPASPGSAGRA